MSDNSHSGHGAEGHRERVRQRVRNEGMEHFQPYEILEFILTYAIPRKDVKPIAKKLIEEFGSLSAVLEADVAELAQIEGIGLTSATLLASYSMVMQYYHKERYKGALTISTLGEMGKFCCEYLYGEPNEKMLLVCLDNACHHKGTFVVGEGSIDVTPVFLRKIVRNVFVSGAKQVVLAHNHPSGLVTPSLEDYNTTVKLQRALEQIDVHLIDHLIVTGDRHQRVLAPEFARQLRLREEELSYWECFPTADDDQPYPTWTEEDTEI